MSVDSVFAGGSKLYYASGGELGPSNKDSVDTLVALVTSVNGPSTDVDLLDSTTQDTVGGYRTFIPGLKNPGSVEFGVNLGSNGGDTSHDQLRADMTGSENNGVSVKRRYQFVLTNGENWGFDAYCTQFSGVVPVDGLLTANVTLTISGAVAFDETISTGITP